MTTFTETYNTFKKSPTKEVAKTVLTSTTVINGKREPEFELDKAKKKKIKTLKEESDEESDFDFDSYEALGKALKEDNSQSLSARPKRNSSVQRRKLIISDDEDDGNDGGSKSNKMESEEEYDGRYSDEEELYA